MAISPGMRIGPYEILSALGAGGMGQVYRARDTKLNRDVAIKTLPELFEGHPERIARFEREAQLLAALNHQHIAAIYGLEEASGAQYLVLELVEGESLADRLARGSMSVADTLGVARQIVDALEAAHEKGIIHRDLKPANIMLDAEGRVKVLDFGLAKALEPEAGVNPSHSPTLTFGATQAGVILGTAAYMSPEQAKGRAADKRSDVWAFGCVFFEMLAGRRAFEGEDVSDTLACVLRGEPEWPALPANVPPAIRTLIRRCLEKDRRARIPDVAVVRYLMADAADAPTAAPAPAPSSVPRRLILSVGGAGLVLGAALAVAIGWGWLRWTPAPPIQPMRFSIAPASPPLVLASPDRHVAISRDGRFIVYTAASDGPMQLMVRPIDRLDAVALAGTSGARWPFLSPDGREVAFFMQGELRKVSTTGGPITTICRTDGAPRGGSWGADGSIVFATDQGTLMRVGEGGGDPAPLTAPEKTDRPGNSRSGRYLFPSHLPGERAVLFTVFEDGPQIAVFDERSSRTTTLIRGGSQAQYVESGHLVYAAAGTLRAVRFDPETLTVLSDPVPVLDQLRSAGTGAADYAVSASGTLVYVAGDAGVERTLVWVNREGVETPVGAPMRQYAAARISPDETRLALTISDQEQDIWIWSFPRGTLDRLTTHSGPDTAPVWTPDSLRIIYSSARAGTPNLFWQRADGTGSVERLTTSPLQQLAQSMRDPDRLVLMQAASPGFDLHVLTLDGQGKTQPLLTGPQTEASADLSPDGRYLAYQSTESGRNQIYVRPFPDVDKGREQISIGGGTRPVWSRDGRELFYVDERNFLAAVPVRTAPTFAAGKPARVFERRYFMGPAPRTFDVSKDGRFLMIRNEEDTGAAPTMEVVINWFEELKARVR
jgi:serine/threonine-protein kinase